MPATTLMKGYLLQYHFGSVATFTPPANAYFGLATNIITGTGVATEPISGGNGYDRVTLANDASTWNTPSGGILTNKVAVIFPNCAVSWGDIKSLFLSTTATPGTGDVLWYCTISPQITAVPVNSKIAFDAGYVTITLD